MLAYPKKLNLLPESLRKKQEYKLKRKKILKTFILLISIVLLGGAVLATKIYNKKLVISLLDREIKKTKPYASKIENMLKR